MLRLIGLAAVSLSLGSCSVEDQRQFYVDRAANSEYDIVYSQDKRTNLCFAWTYPGTQAGTMSEVPCSEAVMREISK